ncbi:hypothetical protein ACJMK2_039117 [Sinanodonta woodiana]|uniref:Uncharacterized protein n=1 Tax=Sinanodonta woodiana TaxID=1069815 RepID=A0ABD3WCY8_SINWO
MLTLTPSEIRYSQDSISCVFTGSHRGKKIGKTLDELVDGDISVDNIPTISVVFRNSLWFSYDNRRLWVFKHFELLGGCTQISVSKRTYWDEAKFTTFNEGMSIRVRGNPGGTWYYKYISNPAKYKNYLQHQNSSPYNDFLTQGYADSFRLGHSISSHQSSLLFQSQNEWRSDTERIKNKTVTSTSRDVYGFKQQRQLFGYSGNEYSDSLVTRSTPVTAKTMFNYSPPSFAGGHISSPSSSDRYESIYRGHISSTSSSDGNESIFRGHISSTSSSDGNESISRGHISSTSYDTHRIAHQAPPVASSYHNYYQSTSERNMRDIRSISVSSNASLSELAKETKRNPLPTDSFEAQPVCTSTPSTSTTGLRSIQSVFGKTPATTLKETSVSSLYQRQYSLISKGNLKYTPQVSISSSSKSSAAKNNPIPDKSGASVPTERSRGSVTSRFESKPASKSILYSAASNQDRHREENKEVNTCNPLTTSRTSITATETANAELPAQKAPPKLKPASRQPFLNIITVNQIQCSPKKPVLIMLDPSMIRYTKNTLECPLSDERQSAVQHRLRELLQDENPRPMQVYKAYNLYWAKEENDILWSLRTLMNNHSKWGRNTSKVKALVTEDNDAFLDFMRKDKPWLQISDILQLGQTIDISS